ncbi:MAG: hypothetical protein SVO26_06655, partial [Chloroflexota bacterium]|nr:hypothetical protein [Chloroflexota bacterium]
FTSLFVYISIGIAYSCFEEPQTQGIMLESSEYSETETLLINKGNEIIESAVDSCVSQLRNRALYMTIGSSAILLVVIFWRIRRSSQETEQPSPPNGADSTSTNWNL